MAVEAGTAQGVGGDVDDGVGAGQGVEHHGGGGAKRSFARAAVPVGEIEVDLVAVDSDQGGAFDSLVPGEVRKGHASNLKRGSGAGAGTLSGNRRAATTVVLKGVF